MEVCHKILDWPIFRTSSDYEVRFHTLIYTKRHNIGYSLMLICLLSDPYAYFIADLDTPSVISL